MTREFGITTLALALIVPLAAHAGEMDADGDGVVTIEEFEAALPEAAPGTFEAVDVDGDGALNVDEIADARAGGLLPAE